MELSNAFLLLLSIGCAVYIAVDFIQSDHEKEKISAVSGIEIFQDDIITGNNVMPALKSFSFYEETFERRDIFGMPGEKQKAGSNIPKITGADLNKQIKIVGIVLDKDSKVIVEDIKSGQTFFMSEGERIGNAVLEKIQEDRVIFDFNDKKVEFVL